MPNSSVKFWDRLAKHFDRIEAKDEPVNTAIVERAKRFVSLTDTVLDVGCGTGTAALGLAGSVKRIHCIDLSGNMIALARSKAGERGVKNIDFARMTIDDDSLTPASYDAILCFYLLHLLDDLPAALRRMTVLLKPGGRIITATPCLKGTAFGRVLRPLSVIGLVPPLTSYTPAELGLRIADGGFSILDSVCVHPSGRQQFIAASKREPPVPVVQLPREGS